MSTHDQQFERDRYTEEPPTLTLAEPKTATSGGQREQAGDQSEQPEWSRETADPSTAPTEPTVARGEEASGESDLTPAARHAEASDTEPSHNRAAEAHPSREGAESEPFSDTSLFADDELAGLRARWNNVQAGFVDDPRDCVHKADGLVSDVVGQLTASFTDARSRLEDQWGRGEEASTEDLRVALTRYRDFFERLLAV